MTGRRSMPQLGLRLLRALGPEARLVEQRTAAGPCAARALSVLLQRAGASHCSAATRSWARVAVAGPAAAALRAFAAAADLPPHTELTMPALSPTMSHGNMLGWHKKEGDAVAAGDVYCEVETDKATMEWEAQEDGYLAKILVQEGAKEVAVGTPVAVVVENESDMAAFKHYSTGSTPAPSPPAAAAPSAAAKASGGSFPPHQLLQMPALSPTMSQGNILSWHKAAGDQVAAGDVIAEVETDKATMEWEAQEEGVVAKILVPAGTNGVQVGDPVMVIVDDIDAVAAFEGFTAADAEGGAAAPAEAPAAQAAAPPPPPPTQPKAAAAPAARAAAAPAAPGARIKASPYAKKLAVEGGVSLAGVGGSGPEGRIVAADVHALIASGSVTPAGAAAPAEVGAFTDIEATQIRKVIARRLLESKQQIPHYYLTVNCRTDRLMALRQQLNASLASIDGGKLSLNDFVIKAASLALRRVPEVNASWHGDFVRQYHTVDCSVAVQTAAGLMVPVVRDSDKKGLASIAAEVKELAGKAKAGKLRPEEFSGGTFTISNLGMFGVSQFAAIVNPPQAVILAVGAAEKRVVPAAGGGFEEASFMACTLSCDHRVVDGAVGAQWLQAFRGYVEDPASMLL